jgi:hypothetical protein
MQKVIFFLIIACAAVHLHAQTDTSLSEYKGIYKFPEGSVVTTVEIIFADGALTITSTLGSAGLEKVSKDTFSMPSYNGSVYFYRNGDAKVEGIKIMVQDIVLEGKKQEGNGVAYQSRYAIKESDFDFGKKISPQPVQ